jgi:hypothetical protein
MPKKPSKAKIQKERSPAKRKKVLIKKGYPEGKLPKDKVLHHKPPLAEGGETTPKKTRVMKKTTHQKLHAKRRKRGRV